MSDTSTKLVSNGQFCKMRYDTVPVKSVSANVYFYSNNSKMRNFELWHSCRKRTICSHMIYLTIYYFFIMWFRNIWGSIISLLLDHKFQVTSLAWFFYDICNICMFVKHISVEMRVFCFVFELYKSQRFFFQIFLSFCFMCCFVSFLRLRSQTCRSSVPPTLKTYLSRPLT